MIHLLVKKGTGQYWTEKGWGDRENAITADSKTALLHKIKWYDNLWKSYFKTQHYLKNNWKLTFDPIHSLDLAPFDIVTERIDEE